jgi:hypothetical protein
MDPAVAAAESPVLMLIEPLAPADPAPVPRVTLPDAAPGAEDIVRPPLLPASEEPVLIATEPPSYRSVALPALIPTRAPSPEPLDPPSMLIAPAEPTDDAPVESFSDPVLAVLLEPEARLTLPVPLLLMSAPE